MILLIIVSYFFSTIFSGFVIASLFLGFVVIETNEKYAIIFYIASVLLTLILPVNKLSLLFYYSFFGFYGLIKLYFEKIKNIVLAYICKIIFFTIALYLNYLLALSFLPDMFSNEKYLIPIFIVAILVFVMYDYLYGIIMSYYYKRRSKHV